MLDPSAQHYWCHVCTRITHVLTLERQHVLWVVSFARCTAGPNNVGSYCVRWHVALRWLDWIFRANTSQVLALTSSSLIKIPGKMITTATLDKDNNLLLLNVMLTSESSLQRNDVIIYFTCSPISLGKRGR